MAVTKIVQYFVPKKMMTPDELAAWNPKAIDEDDGSDPFGMWISIGEVTGETISAIGEAQRAGGGIPARATKTRYFEPPA